MRFTDLAPHAFFTECLQRSAKSIGGKVNTPSLHKFINEVIAMNYHAGRIK